MDVIDWIVRTLVALGAPAIIGYFVRERRRRNAQDRLLEADAEVAESAVSARQRNTSITSLESEMAAMQRTFETDRRNKDATISWLHDMLTAERETSAQRELKHQAQVSELEGKVATLQRALNDVSAQLELVTSDLRRLKGSSDNS